jgi:hypothetical protein
LIFGKHEECQLKIPLSGGGEIEHAAVFKISQRRYFSVAELQQQCVDSHYNTCVQIKRHRHRGSVWGPLFLFTTVFFIYMILVVT